MMASYDFHGNGLLLERTEAGSMCFLHVGSGMNQQPVPLCHRMLRFRLERVGVGSSWFGSQSTRGMQSMHTMLVQYKYVTLIPRLGLSPCVSVSSANDPTLVGT